MRTVDEIKYGKFCSGYYELREVLTPYWELSGWVYRGGDCKDWLHKNSSHKDYFLSWWNIKEIIKREIKILKYIYMGYANCPDFKCEYCKEKAPQEVQEKIMNEVNKNA